MSSLPVSVKSHSEIVGDDTDTVNPDTEPLPLSEGLVRLHNYMCHCCVCLSVCLLAFYVFIFSFLAAISNKF